MGLSKNTFDGNYGLEGFFPPHYVVRTTTILDKVIASPF